MYKTNITFFAFFLALTFHVKSSVNTSNVQYKDSTFFLLARNKAMIERMFLSGDVEKINEALKEDVNINCTDEHGNNALHIVAYQENFGLLNSLLNSQVNASQINKDNFTYENIIHIHMFLTAKIKEDDIHSFNSQYGNHINYDNFTKNYHRYKNYVDKNKNTALHNAAYLCKRDLIDKFLKIGVNPSRKNNNNQTYKDLLKNIDDFLSFDKNKVKRALQANVWIDSFDKHGNTVLHLAAYKNTPFQEFENIYGGLPISINARNHSGLTQAMILEQNKRTGCIDITDEAYFKRIEEYNERLKMIEG